MFFFVGESGKQFWGQNHTVMEGHNLTLHCGSKVKSNINKPLIQWFWAVEDRSLGTKALPRQELLQKLPSRRRVTRIKPFGFTSMPEYITGTFDMKLINVNRYASGKYMCAVATIISRKNNYVEGTYQNVLVKCKDLRC